MPTSSEEPTGMLVRTAEGQEISLTFPAFVLALESGRIGPEDTVWSRIVTDNQWRRVGSMRIYVIVTGEARTPMAENDAQTEWSDDGIWPPAPLQPS